MKFEHIDLPVQHFYMFDLTPVAKERPRMRMVMAGKRSFATAYTPAKTKSYEKLIKKMTAEQMVEMGHGTFQGNQALKIRAIFYLPRAKSCKEDEHTKAPDLDNFVKSLLDGMQGVAFEDDKSIVELEVKKGYADGIEPHVAVHIIPVKLAKPERSQDEKTLRSSEPGGAPPEGKGRRKRASKEKAKAGS